MRAFEEILKVLNEDVIPPFLFTAKNITLGLPSVSADPVHNTAITVTGIPYKGYANSKSILYKRLALDQSIKYEDGSDVVIRSRTKPTKSSLLNSINAVFNLYLTPEDVLDFDIPDFLTGLETPITLVAVPNTLAWVGSVTFTLVYGRPFLNAVVTQRSLAYQTFPTTNTKVLSTRMVMWDVDCTCLGDALTLVAGRFKDAEAVNKLLLHYGIVNYQNTAWKDDLTVNVPEANPAYDRVVVCRYNPNNATGYIYLHYNVLEG